MSRFIEYLNEKTIVPELERIEKELLRAVKKRSKLGRKLYRWLSKNSIDNPEGKKDDVLINDISKILSSYGIEFEYKEGSNTHLQGVNLPYKVMVKDEPKDLDSDVKVYYGENFIEDLINNPRKSIASLISLIKHEGTHKIQIQKKASSFLSGNIEPKSMGSGSSDDPKEYFSNKQEIMAYANSIVSQLINQRNITSYEEVKKILKNPKKNMDLFKKIKSPILFYFDYFDMNDKVMKRLFRQMYDIIEEYKRREGE